MFQLGWNISPAIERAKVSRTRQVLAEPKPLPHKQKPVPAAREPFTPVEVTDYAGLIAALRSRVEHLGISRETLDELAGTSERLASKVLGLGKTRRIGMQTLGAFLAALSVKLVLVEDPAALEQNRLQYKPRDDAHYRAARAGHDRAALERWAAARGLTVEIGYK